jgi:ABC-2 type transport system permease protein
MPVDVASYRRWDGRARATRLATFSIAATMIRRRLRNRFLRFILFAVMLGAAGISALVYYLVLAGEVNFGLRGQVESLGLADVNLLALLNRGFDGDIGFWAVLTAALVGAPVIAEDRRARALPLYFSRPIGHLDYVLGKALSAAFFLAMLLLLPRVAMYVVDIAFADEEGQALRQLPTLLRSLAVGALGVFLLTSVALGVSSVADRPTHASLFFLGLMVLSAALAAWLSRFLGPPWQALNPYSCVQRVGVALLDVPERTLFRTPRPLLEMPVGWAWAGLGVWPGAGLLLLVARIRRVEVVT